MQEYLIRLEQEQKDLAGRLERLEAFTSTDTFKALSTAERGRMIKQSSLMTQYLDILNQRLEAARAHPE